MSEHKDQKHLIYATVAIWGLTLVTALLKTTLFARRLGTVTLVSEPKIVRININGVPHQNGRYLETPVSLELEPGKTKLKIMREGYQNYVANLEMNAGAKVTLSEVRLVPKGAGQFVPIEVTGDRISKPYYVEIDKGLLKGETPLVADNLPRKGKHILEVFPQGPRSRVKIRCTFALAEPGHKGSKGANKIKIKISSLSDGTYHFTGCREE